MSKLLVGRRGLLGGGFAATLCVSAGAAKAARPVAPGGFAPAKLADIPKVLQGFIDREAAVGVVSLLYRRGEVAQVSALGFQDREAGLRMQRDSIFRLASMTKPMTSVAMLTLVDQGKIGLFDPIDRWLPELARPRVLDNPEGSLSATHPATRSITVADLLTHRAGFAGQFSRGPVSAPIASLRSDEPSVDAWLRRLAAIPLAYEPGTTWSYGTSYDVLGVLIGRVSGRSYHDYLKEAVWDPLGMKDTGVWISPAKQKRLATLYGFDAATGKRAPISRPVPDTPRDYLAGAGRVVSTADDYLRFAQMLLNKGRLGDTRILSRPMVAQMTTNWLTPEQRATPAMGNPRFWSSQGFGLGVAVTDNIANLGDQPYSGLGSYSWPGAFGTWWRADPEEQMIGIYLVQNTADTTTGRAQSSLSMRALYEPQGAFGRLAYDAIET